MSPSLLIFIYCILTALASYAGGWLPAFFKPTHLRKQLMLSLVAGVILGVALLNMLPHAVDFLSSIQWAAGAMLCGLLVMFFLLRVFHVHHDHQVNDPSNEHDHRSANDLRLSWLGLFIGMTGHSLLDGVALAASVATEVSQPIRSFSLLGFSTFLAVFLHKPLDALSITSLMRTAEWSPRSQTIVNFLFALVCPFGALLFWLGTSQILGDHQTFVGCALAFSAGFFLCIALSDLLPEVAFHSHDRASLSTALLLGVILAIGIELVHSHNHIHDHALPEHHHSEHAPHDH